MLYLLQLYQIQILFICGIVGLFVALFAMAFRFPLHKKKIALVQMELGTGLLLILSASIWQYAGDPGSYTHVLVRICKFLIFFLLSFILYAFNSYLVCLLMGQGKYTVLPKQLFFGFVMPVTGMILSALTYFTKAYLSFDEFNNPVRGPLLPLAYIIPIITLLIQLSLIIRSRHMLKQSVCISLIVFMSITILAGIVQLWVIYLPIFELALFLSSLVLFWLVLIEQNHSLVAAATTEIMTGLPNSYGFRNMVDNIVSHGDITNYNGFYFDIVRMGRINSLYGLETGDKVLKKYAEIIRERIDKDEVLGRLGGNYFVALIKKSNTEQFLNLLSDIPVKVKYHGETEIIHVSAIAGGYKIDTKRIDSGQILGNCSHALSYAKGIAKKPYVFLDSALDQELKEAKIIAGDAYKALNSNSFIPYYQPKVNSETGELCGAEALVRWQHNGQLVSPFKFIPIMEKNGNICNLDFYMIEHVLMDMTDWLNRGIKPVCVSINLSRKNLGNPTLAGDINDLVEKYHISKKLIQIEVTETIDEFPLSYLKGVVDALHRYGFTVAIDDFGTGSSSINLLKEIQFDVLKIDKSFIDYTNEHEKKLLSYICQIADVLGLPTIAEGVETKDRLDVITQMGCHDIQGYVYDKPLEKSEFEKRLKNPHYTID